jgi:hypothetical protein
MCAKSTRYKRNLVLSCCILLLVVANLAGGGGDNITPRQTRQFRGSMNHKDRPFISNPSQPTALLFNFIYIYIYNSYGIQISPQTTECLTFRENPFVLKIAIGSETQ